MIHWAIAVHYGYIGLNARGSVYASRSERDDEGGQSEEHHHPNQPSHRVSSRLPIPTHGDSRSVGLETRTRLCHDGVVWRGVILVGRLIDGLNASKHAARLVSESICAKSVSVPSLWVWGNSQRIPD